MDIIFLNGMAVETVVGVYEWERQQPQKLLVDISVGILENQDREDDLRATLSYADIAQLVRDDMATQRLQLLESVAERIAELLLAHAFVQEATIKVVKPGILPASKEVGIQITRRKAD